MLASILINNRNYGRFLDYCVRSALEQTYSPVEVIVCDDGSVDESREVLSRYGDRIQWIPAVHDDLPPCFCQAKAINLAFERSSGAIICLLDSDDAFLPDKVERVVRAFDRDGDAVLVQHPFLEIDENDRRTGIRRPALPSKQPRELIYRTHSLSDVFAQTSALSFRRSYLEQVLPIVPDAYDRVWPDVRLTRLGIFYGTTSTLRDPLAEHRIHADNDSANLQDESALTGLIEQLYRFFNEQARLRGEPTVDLDQSPSRPGLKGARRLSAQWRAAEGFQEKVDLTRRWITRARAGRRRTRPRAAEKLTQPES